MNSSIIFIMGVSGSGKSVVGQLLAQRLGIRFIDADDFHPIRNIEKMKAGIALTDADREPWLKLIHAAIITALQTGPVVVACSALRQRYRDILEETIRDKAIWVFLRGDERLISARLHERVAHFMPPSLLQTQFATLEEPINALILDISNTPEELVTKIIDYIKPR